MTNERSEIFFSCVLQDTVLSCVDVELLVDWHIVVLLCYASQTVLPGKILVPIAVVMSVRIAQSVVEKAIVVLNVGVMNLEPNSWHMDRIDMRRKTSMRVEDVLANVTDAGNDVTTVIVCLFQVTIAEVGFVDFGKQFGIFVN